MKQVHGVIRRALALLLCAALLFAVGCGSDPAGKTFRCDIPERVANLDPQFATASSARLILYNLFEGLLHRSPEGELLPGVARSYTVSQDGLRYTFELREDAVWSNGEPVTAADFVFTFRRLLRDGSPYAQMYAAIQGAQAVLDGTGDVSGLGVTAETAHRLVIALERPDSLLLERLCDPAAFPCNEQAYTASRGRYGLDMNSIATNGPFELNRWDDVRISVQKSESYRSEQETVAGMVHFFIGRDAAEQFLDGKTDLALLTGAQRDELREGEAEILPITRTVWCIVFNQDSRLFGNALLRQGLAYSLDRENLAVGLSPGYAPTSLLVPDAMRVAGKPYREFGQHVASLEYDPQEGKRLFRLGLDALGYTELPGGVIILVPENAKADLAADVIQQGWQKYLSAYVNFEVAGATQIQNRLRNGDYQMLLMPFTPADSDILTLLGAFRSDSAQNYFGYAHDLYDSLLEQAGAQPTPERAAAKYAQAESALLSDAVVLPVAFEPSFLALASGVECLEISPFGDYIYFKYAQKAN